MPTAKGSPFVPEEARQLVLFASCSALTRTSAGTRWTASGRSSYRQTALTSPRPTGPARETKTLSSSPPWPGGGRRIGT